MTTTEDRALVRPQRIRCSDRERIDVVTVLGSGLGEGRLTPEEFEYRADAAYAARWRSDLGALVADLPLEAADPPTTSLDAWLAIARQAWFQLRVDADRLFRDADDELRVGRCVLGIIVAALVLIAGLRGLLGDVGPAHLRH